MSTADGNDNQTSADFTLESLERALAHLQATDVLIPSTMIMFTPKELERVKAWVKTPKITAQDVEAYFCALMEGEVA